MSEVQTGLVSEVNKGFVNEGDRMNEFDHKLVSEVRRMSE